MKSDAERLTQLLKDIRIQKAYYSALRGVAGLEESILACKKPQEVIPILVELDSAFAKVRDCAEEYKESMEAVLTNIIRTDVEPS